MLYRLPAISSGPFALIPAILTASFCFSGPALAQPLREVFRPQLIEAAWYEGAVFTSDRNGLLQRWDEGTQIGITVDAPGPVHSMCVLEGQLYVATPNTKRENSVGLFRKSTEGWDEILLVDPAEEGGLFGLTCEEGEPLLLTGSAVHLPLSRKKIAVKPQGAVAGGTANLFRQGEVLWLGFDSGEWGGGLHRIDLSSGAYSTFEVEKSDDLCAGLLNPSCDPVHAIVDDVVDPACIVVASGLSHFLRRGYLARVCSDRAEVILSLAATPPMFETDTAPFTSLARKGGRIFALEERSVKIIDSSSKINAVPLELENWAFDQRIDWSHPDFVIVDGDPIQREEKNSYSWLLVARR